MCTSVPSLIVRNANPIETCKCGFDIRVVLCASVPRPGTLTQQSYRQKCKLIPEAVCKLVNVVLTLEWYCVPVYQVS